MRVATVAVGAPRTVVWYGREVSTSIFKTPVDGPVAIRRHNLDGDRQADLRVHGGEYKAVYAYARRLALHERIDPVTRGELAERLGER